MNDKQWSLPLRFIVLGVLVILAAIALWYIRPVLQPLIIAAFTAYLINPAVNFLTTRTRLSRRAAVLIAFTITVILLIGAPASMTLFLGELQQIIRDIGAIINQLTVWLADSHTVAGFPLDLSQLAARFGEFRATFIPTLAENALQLLEQTSMGALWIIVTMVAVYYLLAEWPNLKQRFLLSFPQDLQPEIEELYRRLRTVWMNYLRGQILLMLIVGVVFTLAWTILGIPGALVLGIVAGFLTLIPDVGPFIAAILATAVALLEGSSWINMPNIGVALLVVAVYLVLIGIKNFWLRPFIMGRSVHMNEALVFIFIVLATVLWGILGALLVIPVVSSIVVIFDYLRRRVLGLPPFPEPVVESKAVPTRAGPSSALKKKREKK
jgi:predicted PurR-regulated permease PerM